MMMQDFFSVNLIKWIGDLSQVLNFYLNYLKEIDTEN